MDKFDQTFSKSLKLIEEGSERQTVLSYLAAEAEKILGKESAASILLLDKKGLLRNGASPRLPEDYLAAIDGIKPHPGVGTCAAVAATGNMVLTPDFMADDKWNELRHLPMSIGYSGAWSVPVKSPQGKVLGTFGVYLKETGTPSDEEIKGVEKLAAAAGIALSEK